MNTTKQTDASRDEVQVVLDALVDADQKMGFLKPLNEEQRAAFHPRQRLGSKGWSLLQMRVELARNHRDLLPPMFDQRQFEDDVDVAIRLQSCLDCLDKMRQRIGDHLLTLGARAGEAGLLVNQYIQVATATQKHAVAPFGRRPARSRRSGSASAALPPTATAAPTPTPASTPTPAPAPAPGPTPASAPAPVQAADPEPATSPVTPKQDAA